MMETVIADGAGRLAAVEGLTVGGKTGTAQLGGDAAPHAWFAGYAQKDDRSVVIVVMLENGGSGAQVAAPIFAQLAASALR
jgi:peptidoglycan glycosyltransferase